MAASTRIAYNPTSIGGIHLANAVRYSIIALQEINRAAAMAAAITGGGATQTNLEGSAEFGAVSVANGGVGGPVTYSAITTLQTQLAAITQSMLANLDQGG